MTFASTPGFGSPSFAFRSASTSTSPFFPCLTTSSWSDLKEISLTSFLSDSWGICAEHTNTSRLPALPESLTQTWPAVGDLTSAVKATNLRETRIATSPPPLLKAL